MAARLRPRRALSVTWVLLVLLATGSPVARWSWRTYVAPGRPPAVESLDLYARMADLTPLTITIAGAMNAPWQTTIDDLGRNRTLWRLMHLENWNSVPDGVREEMLGRMLEHYRPVMMTPSAWDAMSAADWDDVPQPVRTVAYRQMTAYWAGFYGVGESYGLDPRVVRDTLQAIVMSESWFDHRAHRVDYSGNHDVGLAQASDYARTRLRQLAAMGIVDISLADEDYWNPWKATRFLAVWMSILLDEAAGDLDRAVGAYNRGIARADDQVGLSYLAAVQRRRWRFIQNHDAPPAWTWLWRRAREVESAEWPWLHRGTTPGAGT